MLQLNKEHPNSCIKALGGLTPDSGACVTESMILPLMDPITGIDVIAISGTTVCCPLAAEKGGDRAVSYRPWKSSKVTWYVPGGKGAPKLPVKVNWPSESVEVNPSAWITVAQFGSPQSVRPACTFGIACAVTESTARPDIEWTGTTSVTASV